MTINFLVVDLRRERAIQNNGEIMKFIGIVIMLSGIVFVLFTIISDVESTTATSNWSTWVGFLVLVTGGVSYYIARDEE